MLISHRKKDTYETVIPKGEFASFGSSSITTLLLHANAETVVFRQPYASAHFHLGANSKINRLVGIIACVRRPFHKKSCVSIKPFVRELGANRNADEMPKSFPTISVAEPTVMRVKPPSVIILNARQQRPMLVETDFGVHAHIRVIDVIQINRAIQCIPYFCIRNNGPFFRVLCLCRKTAKESDGQCDQNSLIKIARFHNCLILKLQDGFITKTEPKWSFHYSNTSSQRTSIGFPAVSQPPKIITLSRPQRS